MLKIKDNCVYPNDMYKIIDYELIIPNILINHDYIIHTRIHPNILSPYMIQRGATYSKLLYKVLKNGMTLREFINKNKDSHKHTTIRNTIRNTILPQHKLIINPIEIMLQIIDAYEYIQSNNSIFPVFSINPDYIWIQYDVSGKQTAHIINIIENNQLDVCEYCINSDKKYWPPEILGKYNHVMYNDNSNSEKIILKLNKKSSSIVARDYSRKSTIGSVYSIGLVLYFITFRKDPFEEHRLHEDDTPDFTGINKNNNFIKIIKFATITDLVERPTILDLKEYIIHTMVSKYTISRYLKCFNI